MKTTLKYIEALGIVLFHRSIGTPNYIYAWWIVRLSLIKKGYIK